MYIVSVIPRFHAPIVFSLLFSPQNNASTLEAASHSSSTAQVRIWYLAEIYYLTHLMFFKKIECLQMGLYSHFAIVSIVSNYRNLGLFLILASEGRSLDHWFRLFNAVSFLLSMTTVASHRIFICCVFIFIHFKILVIMFVIFSLTYGLFRGVFSS